MITKIWLRIFFSLFPVSLCCAKHAIVHGSFFIYKFHKHASCYRICHIARFQFLRPKVITVMIPIAVICLQRCSEVIEELCGEVLAAGSGAFAWTSPGWHWTSLRNSPWTPRSSSIWKQSTKYTRGMTEASTSGGSIKSWVFTETFGLWESTVGVQNYQTQIPNKLSCITIVNFLVRIKRREERGEKRVGLRSSRRRHSVVMDPSDDAQREEPRRTAHLASVGMIEGGRIQ